MDPFSLTVGIAGLISVTWEVTKIISSYKGSVKHAADESRELVAELALLADALAALDRSLKGGSVKLEGFQNTSVLHSTICTCDRKLRSLQSILTKFMETSEGKKWYRIVVWPIKKEEHLQTIRTLHRCMQIFQFSLTVDGWTLLSKAIEDFNAIRQTQLNASPEVKEILTLVENIDSSFKDLEQLSHSVYKIQLDGERQKMLSWISGSVDPSTNHNNAIKAREPETGDWLLATDEFYQWMRSGGLLWLHGIPGCGKTVLCSTIIEAVKEPCYENTTHKLAYFYFDFQDSRKQDLSLFLRSLIRQLCANEVDLPSNVQAMYTQYKESGHEPSIGELSSAFFSVVDLLQKEIYIIMDALDEFPKKSINSERRELLDQVKQMAGYRPKSAQKLHLLVLSRDEPDIRSFLGNHSVGEISIRSSKVDADIRKYVRTRLTEDSYAKLPDNAKIQIEQRLGDGAHGMFRWAACQFDILQNCKKPNAVAKALNELPKSLDETYDRILSNIAESDINDARSILQWLAFSARPLTIQEVAEAAILRPGDNPIDPGDRLYDALDILRICPGLISISQEHVWICEFQYKCDVVRFAHFSVQEYLMSGRSEAFSISSNSAHLHIGESCISYLLRMAQPDLSISSLDENPLLQYSAEYWFVHVRILEDFGLKGHSILDRSYKLFSRDGSWCFVNWLWALSKSQPWIQGDSPQSFISRSPLYYATHFGLRDTTYRLLKDGADAKEPNKNSSLLRTASEKGYYEIVQSLLDYGADVNVRTGWRSTTALIEASRKGHYQIVRLLLDHGAEINAHRLGIFGPATALVVASATGHDNIVQLLLEQGAENGGIDNDSESSSSPLHSCPCYGQNQIDKLLTDPRAKANAPSRRWGIALKFASKKVDDQRGQLSRKHEAPEHPQHLETRPAS